jgi:hypothetical protein
MSFERVEIPQTSSSYAMGERVAEIVDRLTLVNGPHAGRLAYRVRLSDGAYRTYPATACRYIGA